MVSEDTLNEENLESKEPIMVKMKDIIKEFATIGGVVTEKPIGNGIQLSKLIKQESMDEEETSVSASELTEKLSTFGNYRKTIFGENDLREVAKGLSELAEYAKQYALTEADENFDKITVNRNMKELTGFSKQFGKIAGEAQQLKERMAVLYEDMGNILGRYFELGEAMDPVGKEDGDIDNDGDKDDSDEYLAKRRKAIAKAIAARKDK
jgi:hypothetical protein|tara:strand:+ start:904 stop:1530 length:627 start_codon:yes stop_codon:yes gene_type:complete